MDAILTVQIGAVHPDHEAVLAAVADLRADLQRAPKLAARERHAGEQGTKGAVVAIVVALTSSTSLATLSKIIQLWLSRDRRRSLKISFNKDGKETTIVVDGDSISTANLIGALSAAVEFDKGEGAH